MPSLSIIIVNWNGGSHLQQALASLAVVHGEVRLDAVWVVDNASTDGSVDQLPTHGLPLQIIRNPTNVGFGAACNQAAERCTSDVLLMLNPDTRLRPGALSTGMAALADDAVGAVGIRLDSEQGTARSCCRPLSILRLAADPLRIDRLLPTAGLHLRNFDHQSSRDVGHVIGAFYFVPRELFARLGGFDERFFVYFEDLDLSTRIRRAGYRIRYDASASALHHGCGTSQSIKATRLFYSQLSRLQLAAKHGGPGGLVLLLATGLLIESPLRLLHAWRVEGLQGTRQLARGYGLLLRQGIAGWLAGRRRIAAQQARLRHEERPRPAGNAENDPLADAAAAAPLRSTAGRRRSVVERAAQSSS